MRDIAQERIDILLGRAQGALRQDAALARRYVRLARRLGMRYLVRLGSARRSLSCQRCRLPLVPGLSSRVRVDGGRVVRRCLGCGAVSRLPLARERAARLRAMRQEADVLIGPEGLTDEAAGELKRQAATKTLINVRLVARLPAGKDRRALVRDIESRTGLKVLDLRGKKLIIEGDAHGDRV